mmetsp:Transcript_31273/g.23238  ORF Transcript_31273/g.23238 Transcript_31273/m.23238 type:complete len:95 (-) Transcript_31273:72-356(-)
MGFYSLSYYLRPKKRTGSDSLLLDKSEIEQLFDESDEVMQFLIQKGGILLDIEMNGGEFLCQKLNSTNPTECKDYSSTPYDLYVVVKLEISNQG